MSIASLITTSVLEIATIEEKYLNTKYFSISLSCVSKKKILEAYYETLEDFIVIVGGFVQYYSIIKHGEDYLKNNYLLFKEKFEENLYKRKNISLKILLLFNQLMEYYEKNFFEEIQKYFINLNGNYIVNYEKILNMVFDLSEIAALTLSGIRFSCNNIKDSILEKNISFQKLETNIECEKECPFLNKGKECLHIIITNELVQIPNWSEKILEIFSSYYKEPQHLSIFMDYKLVNNYLWNDNDFKNYYKYYQIFGAYYFVNVEHIDFGKWEKEIDIVPFQHLSSCILS